MRIAGQDLPARAVREGSFERLDLTLLSVDEQKLPVSLRMRRTPLCEKPPAGLRAGDRRNSRGDRALAHNVAAAASA